MATKPWNITKRKRARTPASVNRLRKRTGHSEAAATDSRRQQTLTQVQWVPSRPPSFPEDAFPRPLGPATRRKNTRSLSKRNSTLTQMDFFSDIALLQREMDDAPIEIDMDARSMPQLDGGYDSPRKPRKRKAYTAESPFESMKDVQGSHKESQDYKPPMKRNRRKDVTGSPERTSRRVSRRLAETDKILSDPKQNFNLFHRALSRSPSKEADVRGSVTEIQDSTATNDDTLLPTSQSNRSKRSSVPRTPQKSRIMVPSSQSPESLRPTTEKRSSTTRLPGLGIRSPLGERSVNLPPISSTTKSRRRAHSRQGFAKTSKVVTLKLSKQVVRPQRSSIEDSQKIWSIPVTSSPDRKQSSSPDDRATQLRQRPLGLSKVPSKRTEIPDTSQAGRSVLNLLNDEGEDTLPSPRLLFAIQRSASSPLLGELPVDFWVAKDQHPRFNVETKDFAQSATPRKTSARVENDAAKASSALTPLKKPVTEVIADSESDFDSPIANDTQFNAEVARRISSPQPESEASHETVSTQLLSDATSKLRATAARHVIEVEAVHEYKAPAMPKPRLVRSGSPPPSREEINSDPNSEGGMLPQTRMLMHTTQTQTTRVPLNDILPSSSPSLLHSNRSITQRSVVRPLSMPYPSQISTQEATQTYVMSSMIADEPQERTPMKIEMITIKDSSSIRIPLSQIPAHAGSQVVLNADLGLDALDDEDENEELDLNPPSTAEDEPTPATNDHITNLASKQSANSTIRPSARKRKRTPNQVSHQKMELDSSDNEEDQGLDPRSSHRTVRRRFSIPFDARASDSQNFTSTAGSNRHVPGANADNTEAPRSTGKPGVNGQPSAGAPEPPSTQSSSQSPALSPPLPSSKPPPLQRQYDPLVGFNNETQSNFTQGGHVSAAYIHRQREKGALPAWYNPKPYKVPGYTRR